MRRINIILLLLLNAGVWNTSLTAQEITQLSGSLNLQQCIETAIRNNLVVRQAAYQAESDKISYQQSRANRLPLLSGNVFHGVNQGRSIDPFTNTYQTQQINFANYSINTSVTIWNGSSIRNNTKQNELNAQASEMDWQQEKNNLTINVILAYLQVLNNQEQLSIARKQVEVTRNQVNRLEILNNNGAIAPPVFYDMKGQFGNDALTVTTIKNNLETAKLTLAQLLNVSYNSNLVLEPIQTKEVAALYEGSPSLIYETATQQLPLVKAADLRMQSAQKSVLVAKAQRLPVLSLNGGLGTNYSSVASRQELISTSDMPTNGYVTVNNTKIPVLAPQSSFNFQKIAYGDQWRNNFNSSLSIGLSIPILNRLFAKNQVKQAIVREKLASFEAQTTKTQLRQDIDQAYLNMNTSLERYQTLTRQVEDYTVSFKAAEVRFNAGVNTSIEYLLAKNNLDRAQANWISARYDYLLRIKILDFYQGKSLW